MVNFMLGEFCLIYIFSFFKRSFLSPTIRDFNSLGLGWAQGPIF